MTYKKRIRDWVECNLNNILRNVHIEEFYLAGGSVRINEKINDLDIFPVRKDQFKDIQIKIAGISNVDFIETTKHFSTFIINNMKVQFINTFRHPLKELIESFDYSHVQIGCKVVFSNVTDTYKVTDIYYSKNHIMSRIMGETEYQTGKTCMSRPIHSLVRSYKYYKRGFIRDESLENLVCNILNEYFRRYKDLLYDILNSDMGIAEINFADMGNEDDMYVGR